MEYLLVGGAAAQVYGAARQTSDFDYLASTDRENLERLAAAMRELNARLRVEPSPNSGVGPRPEPDHAGLASLGCLQ